MMPPSSLSFRAWLRQLLGRPEVNAPTLMFNRLILRSFLCGSLLILLPQVIMSRSRGPLGMVIGSGALSFVLLGQTWYEWLIVTIQFGSVMVVSILMAWRRISARKKELIALPVGFHSWHSAIVMSCVKVVGGLCVVSAMLWLIPILIQRGFIWRSTWEKSVAEWLIICVNGASGHLLVLIMYSSIGSRILYNLTRKNPWTMLRLLHCTTPLIAYLTVRYVSTLIAGFIQGHYGRALRAALKTQVGVEAAMTRFELNATIAYGLLLAMVIYPFYRLFPARDYARFNGQFFDE